MSITVGSTALARRLNTLIKEGRYKELEQQIKYLSDLEIALKYNKNVPDYTIKALGLVDKNTVDDLGKEPLINTMLSYANEIDDDLFTIISSDDSALHAMINITAAPLYRLATTNGYGISHAILEPAIQDETILYAIKRYPKLCDTDNRNESPIWVAYRRPRVMAAIIEQYKKYGILIPRSTIGDYSPHATAVKLSHITDDKPHQSLKMLLEAEPNPSEITWLYLLQQHKSHLIYLYPAHIKSWITPTLGTMVINSWTDEEIVAMVGRGAPIRSIARGSTFLQNIISMRRWELLTKLLSYFTQEWNVGDTVNRCALQVLIRLNSTIINGVYKYKMTDNIPSNILDEAILRTDLRHVDISLMSVLEDLLLVMPPKDVFKHIVGKPFHVRNNRYGMGPLTILTAPERVELWNIAVDNFLMLAKQSPPYRTLDKECADNPTKECRDKILARCKKTGICYPTPIHWAPFRMPIMRIEKTPTYFVSITKTDCLYITELLSQYSNIMIPFMYPDDDMINTRNLVSTMTGSMEKYEPAKRLQSFKGAGTIAFDYFEIIPHQKFDLKFDIAIRNALAQKTRWLFFLLITDSSPFASGTHANLVLVDLKENLVERFDPNRTTGSDHYELGIEKHIGVTLRMRLELLLSEFREKPVKLSYKSTVRMLNYPFGMSGTNHDFTGKMFYDPEGYCAAYCYLYLELRVLNPDVSSEQIIGRLVKFEQKKGIDSSELIRAYARTINYRSVPYIQAAGLSEDDFFKIKFPNTHLDPLVQYLSEFFYTHILK